MANPKTSTFFGHLKELRTRIFICLFGILSLSVLGWFLFPWFHDSIRGTLGENLYLTTIAEGFNLRFSVSIVLGLVFASPLILIQILGFILPAMNGTEKAWTFLVLIISSILLFFGVIYGFKLILPVAVEFLKSSEFNPNGVQRIISYSTYLDFFLQFLLAFGLSFQMPIFIVLFLRMKIFSIKLLLKMSKWFVIGIFVVAAVITPPDVASQLAVAIPMVGLFYLSILVGWIIRPRGGDVRYRIG